LLREKKTVSHYLQAKSGPGESNAGDGGVGPHGTAKILQMQLHDEDRGLHDL
jgi:hypothetical protein